MRTAANAISVLLLLLSATGCDSPMGDVASQAIRAFVYEPFRIPSGGMAPTLYIGDHIYVSKSAYRSREPIRGEIVAFHVGRPDGNIVPADKSPGAPTQVFIKRIIGVPGDDVEWVNGRLLLNGIDVPQSETERAFKTYEGKFVPIFKTKIGEVDYEILREPDRPELDLLTTKIPPDRFFVVGDFRTSSNDSRSWGTVHRSDLIGPAIYRYYSGDAESGEYVWEDLGLAP